MDKSKYYDGKDYNNMYMTSFIQMIINSGYKVKSEIINGGWLEFDTETDLDIYYKHKLFINNYFLVINYFLVQVLSLLSCENRNTLIKYLQ